MASAAILVQPTGELWKQIRVELNEDVNTRDMDLAHIKEWLKKQPHLPDELGTSKKDLLSISMQQIVRKN